MNHFDTEVIQRAYYQYHDFNLSYLTFTSIGLLLVSHVVTAAYWASLEHKPKVITSAESNIFLKNAKSCIPYCPVVLPVLLFCRLAELKLTLHSMDFEQQNKDLMWSLMEEKMLVHDTANDVKIIGKSFKHKKLKIMYRIKNISEMVTESFGQLIITCLLIFRFQWLVEKDFKSFGIDFKTYIILTMIVSFLTMIHAIHKYHKRHRASLRPMTGLGAPLLLCMWTLLIVTKVIVYVIGFINTPGFFFVPVLIKVSVSFVLFQCFIPDFRRIQSHKKFIYLLISFLLPISLPSKQFKSMQRLNIINFLLYFFECSGVLVFAALMKHFYHNKLYCKFYTETPQRIFGSSSVVTSFEMLLGLLFLLVLSVTVLSSVLLGVNAKYLHPKKKLFNKVPETKTEAGQHIQGIINEAMAELANK